MGLVSFGGLPELQLGQEVWFSDTELFSHFYTGAGFRVAVSGKSVHYSTTTIYPDIFVDGRWMIETGLGLLRNLHLKD